MAKALGKDLEFWFNGVEIPVVSIGESEVFDTLDSTDSSTPGDGKDFEVNRAARSFTVEGLLRKANGTLLDAGDTLVIGKTYQVVDVGTGLAAYVDGQIFTAETAIVLAGDDECQELGAVVTGKTMEFNNGGAVCLVSADYSVKFDTLDVTDSCTTGDGSETVISRAERETKLSAIVDDATADLLEANPTAESCTLTFNTGQTVVGSAIPVSKEIADEAAGFAKVDYVYKWKGAPTETAVGLALDATAHAFEIILRRGTTNKSYAGDAILTGKTVSADIKGITKVSYSFMINGAVTYAEHT